MKLLKQPSGKHLCGVYAMAMLLDVLPEEIIDEFGHDGLEKVWPYDSPHCYKGHHIQEIIDVFMTYGYALLLIEKQPRIGCAKEPGSSKEIWAPDDCEKRLNAYLKDQKALLIGQAANGNMHACAWDGTIVYDPNGEIYPLEQFKLLQAWLMISSHRKK